MYSWLRRVIALAIVVGFVLADAIHQLLGYCPVACRLGVKRPDRFRALGLCHLGDPEPLID